VAAKATAAAPARAGGGEGRRLLAWVPNAVTSCNLLLGFFSVLISLRALRAGLPTDSPQFATACWLILWATLGDMLDGKLAKLLKASSDFGMYLDTFADAVTFGMAPAVLLYAAFLRGPAQGPFVALAPLGYFLAACFRLARYNVQTVSAPRFGFVGVPTPTAALIATSLYLCSPYFIAPSGVVAALMGLVAVSMVSPLRYPGFKGMKQREVALVLALLACMVASWIHWGAARTVFFTFTSFAFTWGVCWIPLRPYWVPGTAKND
jgi:CDP-diacylglycerol--serine O-phosphatidyltransferase